MADLLCLLHFVTCLLPVVATTLFAGILIAVQVSSGIPITEDSVSFALAVYPNYAGLLAVLIVASTLMYITTAVRNVQVRIWFRRLYGSYLQSCCGKKRQTRTSDTNLSAPSATCLAITNDLASVVNILAYTAFLLLAIFPQGSEGWRNEVHNYASITYFVLASIYGILQTMLTWQQGDHYPRFVRIVLLLLVLFVLANFVTYAYTYLGTDKPAFVAEWLAVFGNLLFVAFFAVMFHIDSASDELVEFFCPCCCSESRKGEKSTEGGEYDSKA